MEVTKTSKHSVQEAKRTDGADSHEFAAEHPLAFPQRFSTRTSRAISAFMLRSAFGITDLIQIILFVLFVVHSFEYDLTGDMWTVKSIRTRLWILTRLIDGNPVIFSSEDYYITGIAEEMFRNFEMMYSQYQVAFAGLISVIAVFFYEWLFETIRTDLPRSKTLINSDLVYNFATNCTAIAIALIIAFQAAYFVAWCYNDIVLLQVVATIFVIVSRTQFVYYPLLFALVAGRVIGPRYIELETPLLKEVPKQLTKLGTYDVFRDELGNLTTTVTTVRGQVIPTLMECAQGVSSREQVVVGSRIHTTKLNPPVLTFAKTCPVTERLLIVGHGALVKVVSESGDKFYLITAEHVASDADCVSGVCKDNSLDFPLADKYVVGEPWSSAKDDYYMVQVDPKKMSGLNIGFINLELPQNGQGVSLFRRTVSNGQTIWETSRGGINFDSTHGGVHSASTQAGWSGTPLLIPHGDGWKCVGVHLGSVVGSEINRFAPIGMITFSVPDLPDPQYYNESAYREERDYDFEDNDGMNSEFERQHEKYSYFNNPSDYDFVITDRKVIVRRKGKGLGPARQGPQSRLTIEKNQVNIPLIGNAPHTRRAILPTAKLSLMGTTLMTMRPQAKTAAKTATPAAPKPMAKTAAKAAAKPAAKPAAKATAKPVAKAMAKTAAKAAAKPAAKPSAKVTAVASVKSAPKQSPTTLVQGTTQVGSGASMISVKTQKNMPQGTSMTTTPTNSTAQRPAKSEPGILGNTKTVTTTPLTPTGPVLTKGQIKRMRKKAKLQSLGPTSQQTTAPELKILLQGMMEMTTVLKQLLDKQR